ncbi:hypothetical protein ABZ814_27645 [Micromonospora musae]|uniref:hypothetical protein n=1 Tax=Micromonospora musae TaxID=1894970 RepID=UPI0033F2D080
MSPAARSLAAILTALTVLVAGCGTSGSPTAGSPPASAGTTPPVDGGRAAPSRQPHTLQLIATGDAKIDSFSYVIDGESTEGQSVRLPWRQSVQVPADGKPHEWSLTVRFRDGDVQLAATGDGSPLTMSAAGGSGSGTVSINGSLHG